MNPPTTDAPFELSGLFGGFVFNDAGKRRLLLRQGEHDRLLKVPRLLRRRMVGKFRAGEPIRVAVTEERAPETGVVKQTVTDVLSATATAPGVVRVCTKKNCWRNGGRELWDALTRAAHADNVELRQVGCLDRCKQAPNADAGRHAFSRCSPGEAGAILASVMAAARS